MSLDLLTFGEALVEVMRTEIDQPLNAPALFTGPYPSGAPFIFAAQVARLGGRVGAVGAVGRDPFGDCLLKQMREDNVDTRGVQVLDSHSTGVAFVAYRADGGRDFVFHIKDAAAGQLTPDMLNPTLFDGLKCLHLMGSTLSIHDTAYQTGLRALELAQQHGAKISFDPNLRPELLSAEAARPLFKPFIDAADVLIPTQTELLALSDAQDINRVIQKLLDDKPGRVVVITAGAAGCHVYDADHPHGVVVDGFAVEEVDPTGAGDCFDAGFLVRWLVGDSPATAARFANACGALAVTARGPMAGAQPLQVVRNFINQ